MSAILDMEPPCSIKDLLKVPRFSKLPNQIFKQICNTNDTLMRPNKEINCLRMGPSAPQSIPRSQRRTVFSTCTQVLYNTIQYNTIQYNTIQYNTMHTYFDFSPLGHFRANETQLTKRRNRTTITVKNPDWPEANQLVIYKCCQEGEPETTMIKFNVWSDGVLNPGSPALKATTGPHCLLETC